MSDSLEERLTRQKSAGVTKREAFVEAMKARNARIDAALFAERIPRAEKFFADTQADIVHRITQMASRKRAPQFQMKIEPYEVPRELVMPGRPDRDVREQDDVAYPAWAAFMAWGESNGLSISMVSESGKPTFVKVAVAKK